LHGVTNLAEAPFLSRSHAVDGLLELIGLVEVGYLVLVALCGHDCPHVTTTRRKLLRQAHVALLDGVYHLLLAQPHLAAHLAYLAPHSIDGRLKGVHVTIERCRQLRDGRRITLYCTHNQFPPRVIVEQVGQRITSAVITTIIIPSPVAYAQEDE